MWCNFFSFLATVPLKYLKQAIKGEITNIKSWDIKVYQLQNILFGFIENERFCFLRNF
jgi:hypothetical protein